MEIVSIIFFDHNTMRLDINYKKKTARNTNTWRLNNTFLNNQQVTEEIKREIKQFLETNDNENTTTQNLWDAAKAGLRGKFVQYNPTSRSKKNTVRSTNTWRLNNMFLNSQQVTEEIKREIKKNSGNK